jgi:hypothetical protein
MIAFGNLLDLHGLPGDYPYAAWADLTSIDWTTMFAASYHPSDR